MKWKNIMMMVMMAAGCWFSLPVNSQRISVGKKGLVKVMRTDSTCAQEFVRDEHQSVATNHLLSEVHNPLYATIVPLSAHLLRICETSHSEAWSFQRTCFGYMAYLEMQPLGWFGL